MPEMKTMKHILAVALVVPFLTVASMAQEAHAYQSGPKSSIPQATIASAGAGNAFAMVRKRAPHSYSGGPGTGVPHSY